VKVVIVTQRVDALPERDEQRDALDQRLVKFLRCVGLLAVPVPNSLCRSVEDGPADRDVLDQWLTFVKPTGLVLSGGNDIGVYEERDRTEHRLLDYAQSLLLPALGICRGMQMMSVWAGSPLRKVAGHVRTRHQLTGTIAGDVNSYHDCGLVDCPRGFSVLARSEDEEIEAICHDALPWEGWMWHPEREEYFASRDVDRLRALFAA